MLVPKKVLVRMNDGTIISGEVNIHGNDRISDLFTTDPRPFLTIFNVKYRNMKDLTIIVNKRSISFVIPFDKIERERGEEKNAT